MAWTACCLWAGSGVWDNKAFVQIPKKHFGDRPSPQYLPVKMQHISGITARRDIRGNRVLWAGNLRTRDVMHQVGQTLDEVAQEAAPTPPSKSQ